MKTAITAIAAMLLIVSTTSFAYAEVPGWIKTNAGWWADGTLSESEFLAGLEFLIKDDIIVIPSTTVSASDVDSSSEYVPEWIKTNAGWWADGILSDDEFVNGLQFLITNGIVNVLEHVQESSSSQQNLVMTSDSELDSLQSDLEKCADITKAYDRLNCEKTSKHAINAYIVKNNSQSFQVGPVTYYWPGLDTDGNTFEITSSGQALLNLRILVENTGYTQNESLFCTGPAVCNYDITNGDKVYRYAQMDFTNGQVVLKPGESKMFNMMFGPNIGGGGTIFEYDSGKDYHFRINESFGNASIPLNLG